MFPIPIGTDRPQRHIPWVNLLLIAVNVLIYLMSHPLGRTAPGLVDPTGLLISYRKYMLHTYPEQLVLPGGVMNIAPALYQYISYQFLHADLWHLLGNMLFLYVFGNSLNEKLGNVGYLAFYLTGGVLAGCGQVITSGTATLGASGSISAVTGLFFVLLPRTNVRLFVWIFFFIDVLEIPSMWFILFSIAKDVVESFIPASHVAHSAHLTGNFVGVAIGLLLLGTGLIQRDHYDLLALIDRWRRRRQYENLVRQGYDPFLHGRSVSPPSETVVAAPPGDPRIPELRETIGRLLREHQLGQAVEQYLTLRQIDPTQILTPQDQLDVANQLISEGRYAAAAQAYEDYLRRYQHLSQSEQIQLILGLIYARYLPQPARAAEMLRQALPRLHDSGQREMAQAELDHLPPPPETKP